MKVKILKTEQAYTGFYRLDKCTLQFERFDGTMSHKVIRENFYRGDSVAVLIHDPEKRLILLAKQFRYSVYTKDPQKAWFLEIVAGSGEPNEEPETTIVREIKEEANLDIQKEDLEFINKFYVSPGGTSERISLFAIAVSLDNAETSFTGKQDENEDIEIIPTQYDDAFCLMDTGEICDAKTIIALQWLKLRDYKQI